MVCKNAISLQFPIGSIIQNTHQCYLPIPDLPKKSVIERIFPHLNSASLLLTRQLCDTGCNATMSGQKLQVYLNGEIILTGTCNKINNMWEVTFNSKADTKLLDRGNTSPKNLSNYISNI